MHKNAKVIFGMAIAVYLLGTALCFAGAGIACYCVREAMTIVGEREEATTEPLSGKEGSVNSVGSRATSMPFSSNEPASEVKLQERIPVGLGWGLIGGVTLDFIAVCVAASGLAMIDMGCRFAVGSREWGRRLMRFGMLALFLGPLPVLPDQLYLLIHGGLCAIIQIRAEWRWWRGEESAA